MGAFDFAVSLVVAVRDGVAREIVRLSVLAEPLPRSVFSVG
jgi:hypothetical protein